MDPVNLFDSSVSEDRDSPGIFQEFLTGSNYVMPGHFFVFKVGLDVSGNSSDSKTENSKYKRKM